MDIMMRITICDDNLFETKRYEKIFQKVAKTQQLSYDITYFESGQQMLIDYEVHKKQFADVILLDIHMPGFSGVEAAHELRNSGYTGEIVFLTVSKHHMLDAFDVEAMHYIIKDETPNQKVEEIFLRAIHKALRKEQEYLLLTAGGEYRNVAINSIRYFDIYNKIVTVHYDDQKFEFYCASLGKIEKQLDGLGFFRIHREYIVSLPKVAQCSYDLVKLDNGATLPVGRKYYPLLKEALKSTTSTAAVI